MAGPRVLLVVKGLDLGGLERVVVDLAAGLARAGTPVEVAVVNERRHQLWDELAATGVPVHGLGGTDRVGPAAARRLAALVRRTGHDVVHAHGPLPSVVARLVTTRASVISTAHTPFTSLHPASRALWRGTAWRDAAVVAVSGAVAASLPGRSRRRATVIPHGVDAARIDVLLGARSGEPARDGPLQLITLASHRSAKNYPNLLRALRHALDRGADLHLTALGDGPRRDDHQRLASQLGLDAHVTFEPATPDALVRLAAADVLVVASDYEGQPLVVAEALALGRPVVATAVGRVPELVTPAVGRVVSPGDPVALGDALAGLAADPAERRRLSRAALAAPRWTLDDVVGAHQALYAKVLNG